MHTQPTPAPDETYLAYVELAQEMAWLAYQASSAMGYGFTQAALAAELTEEQVKESLTHTAKDGGTFVGGDYVCGRMMKFGVWCTADGEMELSPANPDPSYQSWAKKYPTWDSLSSAAHLSLKGGK